MDDWTYCVQTLPKVSRTFALNISVLKAKLHRSILTAYLFCRIVDTVEDAAKLDPKIKIKLLMEFSQLIEDREYRDKNLTTWVRDCEAVDGTPNDLDLLNQTQRVFNVFETLPKNHREQIVPAVSKMAKGMAFFQSRFQIGEITPLGSIQDLEEYCYFVAGVVGEMLCNLFFQKLPHLSETARDTMRQNAVSFGLGLQMTNISKDIIADRDRGWSYIPKSIISEKGLTVDEFHSGVSMEKNLQILESLLCKTNGHLHDALKFTLAIPRTEISLRLFCIWPLWMAAKTVSELHNNPELLNSNAQVKISRSTVKRILLGTPFISWSNSLLKISFSNIINDKVLQNSPVFDREELMLRLKKIPLDTVNSNIQSCLIIMSNSNRFKDNQNGTVTDTQTTLTWTQEDGWQKEGKWFTWDEAKEWAGDMSYVKFGGSQDWRLPDEEEILTLYNPEVINKDKYGNEIFLDTIFPPGPQATVWLKSEQGHEGTLFDFKNGETRHLYKSKTGRMSVRLVFGEIPR